MTEIVKGEWKIIRGSIADKLATLFRDGELTMNGMAELNEVLMFYDERLKK